MLFKDLPLGAVGAIADSPSIHPFSILNTRSAEWQSRKRIWANYGIKGELGRDAHGAVGDLFAAFNSYGKGGRVEQTTSIFDPVLCELMYTWLVPINGIVVDPFAGGSVRGNLAHILGRRYWGCDLSKRQLIENRKQAKILRGKKLISKLPKWVHGDALSKIPEAPKADFIFTCPPYADLEVYSDHPNDLSNMSHKDFSKSYKKILKLVSSKLKNNRFACVVISNIRDKNGNYLDLVGDTVAGFKSGGLEYYNENILINPVGSLPIRIEKQFNTSRKFGRCHQSILIFLKGDAKIATQDILKSTGNSLKLGPRKTANKLKRKSK
jgi:DNA modification methylase